MTPSSTGHSSSGTSLSGRSSPARVQASEWRSTPRCPVAGAPSAARETSTCAGRLPIRGTRHGGRSPPLVPGLARALAHPLPDRLSNAEGALLEPLGVALHAVDLGHVQPGSTAGVFGCGPTRTAARPGVAGRGGETIVASDPLPHRGAAAVTAGATLDRREVDVAFEVAGDDAALADAIAASRPGGRVVLVGIPDGDADELHGVDGTEKGPHPADLPADEARRPAPRDPPRGGRRRRARPACQRPLRALRVERGVRRPGRATRSEGRRRAATGKRGSLALSDPPTRSGSTSAPSPAGPCWSRSDGRELGSPSTVPQRRDRRAPAGAPTKRRARARLGAAGPGGLPPHAAGDRPRAAAESGRRPGGRDRRRHRLHGLHDAADAARRRRRSAPSRSARPSRTPGSSSGSTTPRSRRPTASTRPRRERGEPWLRRYGGKISSEWFFAKALQILDEAPEVYAAADRLIEAADWIVWQLTGDETRNSCTAGYKAMWSKRDGFPRDAYFAALDPRFAARRGREDVARRSRRRQPGRRADASRPQRWTGLRPGTAVAVANVDAHVAVPAATVTQPGTHGR